MTLLTQIAEFKMAELALVFLGLLTVDIKKQLQKSNEELVLQIYNFIYLKLSLTLNSFTNSQMSSVALFR